MRFNGLAIQICVAINYYQLDNLPVSSAELIIISNKLQIMIVPSKSIIE